MYKIENFLLIKEDNTSTKTVIHQFLKESNLLISNLYNTYVISGKTNLSFPCIDNKYDTSWYKNILIAARIIEDRLKGKIFENKVYINILQNKQDVGFDAFAKVWNVINLLSSFNMPESEWIKFASKYKLYDCSTKLQALINANITIDMEAFRSIALDINQYKTITNLTPEETQNNKIVVEVETTNDVDDDYEDTIKFDNLNIHLTNEAINTNVKELDLVLKWLSDNKIQIKKYRNIARLNNTAAEYEYIDELINDLNKEIISNNDLLTEIKEKLPTHSQLNELLEICNWSTESNNALSSHIMFEENNRSNVEIQNIEKEIENINDEIFLIDSAYKTIKQNKPNPEALKDVLDVLAWISKNEATSNVPN